MNKQELVRSVASLTGTTDKSAKASVEAVFTTIEKALKKKDVVRVPGFGTFEVRKRKARKGRNPHTGEAIKIKASRQPVFRAGSKLKAAV